MKKFLLVIALIILGLGLNAQSVEDQTTVGSLTFEVTSVSPAECEVSDCEESATDVTIPSSVEIEGTEFSVTSIGNDAFWNCSSLTSIICYAENVPETGSSAFDYCPSDMTIYVPENSVELYQTTSWNRYNIVAIPEIPAAPVVTATATSDTEIVLTWNAVEGATSYNVYSGTETLATALEVTTYTATGLTPETEYSFSVTAVRNEQESEKSDIVTAKTLEFNKPDYGYFATTFFYDFEKSMDGWKTIDSDGDGKNWEHKTGYEGGVGDTGGLYSEAGTIETNNYIVTASKYSITSTSELSFAHIPFDVFYYSEKISVVISEDGETFEDIWSYEYTEQPISWTESKIDLSAYAGKDLYLGFRHCGSTTAIRLDNAKLHSEELAKDNVTIDYEGYSLKFTVTSVSPTECKVSGYTGEPTNVAIPTSVEIEGTEFSVTSIGDDAFVGCSSLTSIETPNSVTSIGSSAFSGCSSLTGIICHAENVPETSSGVFNNCPSDMTIYVPENSVELYKATSPWNNYNIKAIPEIPAAPVVEATATSDTTIILTWISVEDATNYNVYSADTLVANVTDTTYTVTDLKAETEYTFEVSAVNITGESERASATAITLKAEDEPIEELKTPENVEANALSTSSIIITWDNVEIASSYNVYRNDELLTNVTSTNYTDKNLEYNTKYCYTVTSVNDEEESEKSEEVCATTLGESLEEMSSSLNIYPNPVNDKLYIETEMEVVEVSVYDVYGRQLTTDYGQQTLSVDVAGLNSGIYFVKVRTASGEIVKRFVKK